MDSNNKPRTQALIDKERKLSEDIKAANIVAGARYGEGTRYHIPPHQRHEFGEGAKEITGAIDAPTLDHEYLGFKLTCMKQEPWHWTIEAIGFDTPEGLKGNWTRVEVAQKAIDDWHKKEDRKSNKEGAKI
jgi:hypothetical protein